MNTMDKDYLTGLYTRQALYVLYQGMEKGSFFDFMFLDLDNFKNVNDVYGHNTGDLVLKTIAKILTENAPDAYAIRLGGDEFVLLFKGIHSKESLCSIAQNIIDNISNKSYFLDINVYLSASIGLLYHETVTESLDSILAKSDMAMYYAKTHGKSQFIVFNDIAQSVFSEIEMEKSQQSSFDHNEFEIRYLPVISAQTSQLSLSQVRLFWNMSNGTIKSQDEFIPLFEKNGFIRQLDFWVIQSVFIHLKYYHEHYSHNGKIGLRISRLTLLDSDLPRLLTEYMQTYGISPSELDFEIDEAYFVRGTSEILKPMEILRKMGIGISIMGVGSNFRSLAYWDKLMFDSIILDAEYLKNTLNTIRGRQIVKTLLIMGRELKMQVIADGIENKEDFLFLSGCGCNAISGPYYSAPLSLSLYYDYVKDKILLEEDQIQFFFQDNFDSSDHRFKGKILGHSLQLTSGISDKWGAVYFPGGSQSENVLELPAEILHKNSYTICMWMKPTRQTSWTSVIYVKYHRIFATFSPFVIGGSSFYRVCEEATSNGFHDTMSRQVPLNAWTFICLTYDSISDISRFYINGRNAGYCHDIPTLFTCQQILIGGDPFQPSYEGYVSGLIFYNSTKSEEEIINLYNSFFDEPEFKGTKENFWSDPVI